jgi:probable rRNA maturation factor
VAARTAVELDIPEGEELVRLLVHGVLHVLGHDHPEGEDRYGSAMFRLQEELVERLTGAES